MHKLFAILIGSCCMQPQDFITYTPHGRSCAKREGGKHIKLNGGRMKNATNYLWYIASSQCSCIPFLLSHGQLLSPDIALKILISFEAGSPRADFSIHWFEFKMKATSKFNINSNMSGSLKWSSSSSSQSEPSSTLVNPLLFRCK